MGGSFGLGQPARTCPERCRLPSRSSQPLASTGLGCLVFVTSTCPQLAVPFPDKMEGEGSRRLSPPVRTPLCWAVPCCHSKVPEARGLTRGWVWEVSGSPGVVRVAGGSGSRAQWSGSDSQPSGEHVGTPLWVRPSA